MLAIALASLAYDNGAPHSRLPPLGWSSWVALGPNGHHPIFDYCDEASVRRSIDLRRARHLRAQPASARRFWARGEHGRVLVSVEPSAAVHRRGKQVRPEELELRQVDWERREPAVNRSKVRVPRRVRMRDVGQARPKVGGRLAAA